MVIIQDAQLETPSFRIQPQSFAPVFVARWTARPRPCIYVGLEHAKRLPKQFQRF
jgi:hypothetical protein